MDEQNKGSLSDSDTLKDCIGRIRAELSADIEGNRVVLFLEGLSDKRLFERVFGANHERIAIQPPVRGVKALRDLMQRLNEMKERGESSYLDSVVAVRDRDYTNPASYPAHMFAYDHCAMELMLLYHPKMQDTLRNYYTIRGEQFPRDMMRRIALFSLLRRDNDKNGWGINFDKPGVLAGSENNMPDMRKLFGIYEKKYPVLQGRYEEYHSEANALSDSDLWEITNGHDICRLLGNHNQFSDKLYPLDDEAYCFLMIGIYKPEYFQDTALYRDSLSTYELPNKTRPFQI